MLETFSFASTAEFLDSKAIGFLLRTGGFRSFKDSLLADYRRVPFEKRKMALDDLDSRLGQQGLDLFNQSVLHFISTCISIKFTFP